MPDPLLAGQELPKQELPPQEESGVEADEKAFEQIEQTEAPFLEEDAPVTKIETTAPTATSTPPAVVVKDEEMMSVEKILERDLGPLYASLPDAAKPKFKQKGEEVSKEIAGMVRSLQVQAKRVLQLIRDWLLTIPNVNKFFLEQEAKIKTDEIISFIEARKEEMSKRP